MDLLSLKAPSVDYSFHCRSCPLAIAGLSANFLNHSTLHISWNVASPPESVTGYDVIILKENTKVSRVGADNVTSSVEVPSLNQCSNYTVKVAANSSAGPGNYSTLELLTRCGRWLLDCLAFFLKSEKCIHWIMKWSIRCFLGVIYDAIFFSVIEHSL